MADISLKTENFLRGIGMHHEMTSSSLVAAGLREAMARGIRGEPQGLPMLQTYISGDPRAEDGPVLTLDAGGTHLRRALVAFEGGAPSVSGEAEIPMPGTNGETEWDGFIAETAALIAPLAKAASRAALCFSYAARMRRDGDGEPLEFCKEVKIRGFEGKLLGASLRERLGELTGVGLEFTVTNDAAACLLGGRLLDPGCGAAFVLGTGTNTSYLERGTNMLINVESGFFGGMPRGESDLILDALSENPGEHLFEKMFSGAYLGGVLSITAALAAKEGLLPESFERAAPFRLSDTAEFLRSGGGPLFHMCESRDESAALRVIADNLYERAGKLAGASIAAAAEAAGGSASVAAEGAGFRSGEMRRRIIYWTSHTAEADGIRPPRFIESPRLTVTGAAAARVL